MGPKNQKKKMEQEEKNFEKEAKVSFYFKVYICDISLLIASKKKIWGGGLGEINKEVKEREIKTPNCRRGGKRGRDSDIWG